MRRASLIAALLLLLGSVVVFRAGLGPILLAAGGNDAHAGRTMLQWTATVVFLVAWWSGICVSLIHFRGLLRSVASASRRNWSLGDVVVTVGHIALAVAFGFVVLAMLGLRRVAPIYELLMLAATCYAAGLAALARGGPLRDA